MGRKKCEQNVKWIYENTEIDFSPEIKQKLKRIYKCGGNFSMHFGHGWTREGEVCLCVMCSHYLQSKCTRNCFICKFCTDFELFSICSFRFENARDAQMNEWVTPNTLSFCSRLRVLYICIDEIWSWMVFWWHYKISHFVQQWIADKSESRTVGCYYLCVLWCEFVYESCFGCVVVSIVVLFRVNIPKSMYKMFVSDIYINLVSLCVSGRWKCAAGMSESERFENGFCLSFVTSWIGEMEYVHIQTSTHTSTLKRRHVCSMYLCYKSTWWIPIWASESVRQEPTREKMAG